MDDVFVKPRTKKENDSLLTTQNTYADLAEFWIRGYKSKTFVFQATTNDLHFSIDFSQDEGSTWINRLTDIVVDPGTPVLRDDVNNSELRGIWDKCRIQIKPVTSDDHGTGEHDSQFGTL